MKRLHLFGSLREILESLEHFFLTKTSEELSHLSSGIINGNANYYSSREWRIGLFKRMYFERENFMSTRN